MSNADPSSRGRGRPKGRKSDPAYVPLTGRVRRETALKVKHYILDHDMPIGDLLQRLLDDFLRMMMMMEILRVTGWHK